MASVNRILIAPFNSGGMFVGEIKSLTFEYACQYSGSCDVAICSAEEFASVCIQREFSQVAAWEWENWYKANN